jgi:hypothetical protein
MSQLQVTGEAKIRDIQGPVVANSGVITALDGAASQYVRGDGTLADFPTSSGGGSSVSYYLNSSVSQGTIGGVAYRELSKEPIIGAGTDIAISSNGYVASYLTDANDPDVILIPGGNFNCEFYFSVNNNTGNPFFYAELYKYDGTTFTLLGSSVGVPEYINQGTVINPYYFAIPVATATLALTDRLAIRIYVNVGGRTVTLHTENGHLCQVVTTLSKGMVSLNNLTDQSQFLTTGTSGTNFAIVSSGDTHTFNLPVASATNTGKLSSTDWTTFNNKQNALTNPVTGTGTTNTLPKFTGASTIGNSNITDTGSLITLNSNTRINGSIGVNVDPLTHLSLRVNKNLTGNTISTGISQAGVVQSDVLAIGRGIVNTLLTQAATFTLPDYFHYLATQSTLGAGSSITSQIGYYVDNTLIGATSNFAFRGDIPSGTNRWNIYMQGTAANYLAGVLNIGTTTLSGFSLDVNGTARVQSTLISGGGTPLVLTGESFALQAISAGLPSGAVFGTNVANNPSFINILSGNNFWHISNRSSTNANRLGIFNASFTGTTPTYTSELLTISTTGSVGIGTTSLTGWSLRVGRNMTGATSAYGISSEGSVQSDVTTQARGYNTFIGTQATTFTLPTLFHYFASQGTFGAGSTVTNQHGFSVDSGLTGATNNFAFFSNLAAGSGRWNLYMNGTASNYLAGSLAIGTTSFTSGGGTYNLNLAKNITGSVVAGGMNIGSIVNSDVTSAAIGLNVQVTTAAASFTLNQLRHISVNQTTLGAGSSVSNQYGIYVDQITNGTSNFGFFGNIPAGTNRWNLYMAGTAANFMAGTLSIGTTSTSYALTVQGAIYANNDGSSVGLYVNSNGAVRGIGTFYIDTASGSNADLIFRPNIAEALRMKPNGNILIGTTTDAGFKLNVNGTARFTGDVELNGASGTRTLTIQNNTSGNAVLSLVAAGSDSGSITYNRSTSQLVFANSGATSAFVIANNGAATFSSSVTANYGGTFIIPSESPASGNVALTAKTSNGNNDVFRWYDGTTQLGVFKNSGNVGIGTSSPGFKLDINSGNDGSIINLNSTRIGGGGFGIANNGSPRLYIGNANWMGISGESTSSTAIALASAENSALVFARNAAYSIVETMRITSGGNVLIGTTTDQGTGYKLQVNTGTGQNFNVSSDGANSVAIMNFNSGDGFQQLKFRSSVFTVFTGTAGGGSSTERLTIAADGVTKITNLAGTGSRAVLADSSGTLSAPVSDISVKQNITSIGYGLSEILQMNPVWFDFIDEYKNYGEERQNGMIAQEVAKIIPEAVFTTPSTGKMGINYDQMHAVYIKAIQELKAEIEELKLKIK